MRRCDSKVEFCHHPDIHPDDARNAIRAWFRRSCKDRGKPPHIILEKALITSAINEGSGEVLPPVWRDRKGEILIVPSDGFERRWKRAKKDKRRAPIWDDIDGFILKNWRVLRVSADVVKQRPADAEMWSKVPGLCEWCPRAATALIRARPDAVGAGDETWYVQKRNRLGLKGKRRYRVHDFSQYKDGRCAIDMD